MNIQSLVREKIIGNIKIGTKGTNGLPKKLSYFNVEEDKATNSDMVEIFKQLYPNNSTSLKIMFTSENPFNFKYKRYINNKPVCIGNDVKAITIGKDAKGNNKTIEIECNKGCEQRLSGKCKLKGNLKFVLQGIDAGGVWNLSTSGEASISNIATEIVKYQNAGMSIVGVPFELTLTEQQSLAYGTYYSIDLHRTDIKPQLVGDTIPQLAQSNINESKQLPEGVKQENEKKEKKENQKPKIQNVEKQENKAEQQKTRAEEENKLEKQEIKVEEENKEDLSNYLTVKRFMPTLIKGQKFNKIIFEDINSQDVEYILHPKANQEIMNYGAGTLIELKEAKMEMDRNILCKYEVKNIMNLDEMNTNNEELKKAV